MFGPCKSVGTGNSSINYLSLTRLSVAEKIRHVFDNEFHDIPSLGDVQSVGDHKALPTVENSMLTVDSHFEMPIPRSSYPTDLSDNYTMVWGKLSSVKKKTERDLSLVQSYSLVIGCAEPGKCNATDVGKRIRNLWEPNTYVERNTRIHLFLICKRKRRKPLRPGTEKGTKSASRKKHLILHAEPEQ
ncbi:hypothetical protein FGIG_12430 [Fasciola gigantica]|uniref:Uncharacterized protein n=1 Tax=Fasciola gigantica TaxID=46835 RepID=A0A504YQ80_FASGI|nr:hypothetical protein FGIG_12430 [Fasciola gigantica]